MIGIWKTPLTNADRVGLQSHVKYLEKYTHAPTWNDVNFRISHVFPFKQFVYCARGISEPLTFPSNLSFFPDFGATHLKSFETTKQLLPMCEVSPSNLRSITQSSPRHARLLRLSTKDGGAEYSEANSGVSCDRLQAKHGGGSVENGGKYGESMVINGRIMSISMG